MCFFQGSQTISKCIFVGTYCANWGEKVHVVRSAMNKLGMNKEAELYTPYCALALRWRNVAILSKDELKKKKKEAKKKKNRETPKGPREPLTVGQESDDDAAASASDADTNQNHFVELMPALDDWISASRTEDGISYVVLPDEFVAVSSNLCFLSAIFTFL